MAIKSGGGLTSGGVNRCFVKQVQDLEPSYAASDGTSQYSYKEHIGMFWPEMADPKVTFKSLTKIWENHIKTFPLLKNTVGVVLKDKDH